MKYQFMMRLDGFLPQGISHYNLDHHSAIRFYLQDMSPLNIDLQEEQIVVWFVVADYNEQQCSRLIALFPALFPDHEQEEQPELSIIDNEIVISARITTEHITDQQIFNARLQAFYLCYQNISQALRYAA